MISAILDIIASIFKNVLPSVMTLFGSDAQRSRENEAMDKAIAYGDVANISDLLSARFDRVRKPDSGSYSGQPGADGPQQGQ